MDATAIRRRGAGATRGRHGASVGRRHAAVARCDFAGARREAGCPRRDSVCAWCVAPPNRARSPSVDWTVNMEFELEIAVRLLERTPPLLRAWLEGVPEAWLTADEGPNTFSPREVLGHLLHGEDTDCIPRLQRILEHGESRAFDPYDRFAQRRLYGDWPTAKLLDALAARRADNLAMVRGLSLGRADLERRGTHPELGPVTLRQLLSTWVVHDQNHVAQIARVLARQYAAEVGPWRAYLPILTSRS